MYRKLFTLSMKLQVRLFDQLSLWITVDIDRPLFTPIYTKNMYEFFLFHLSPPWRNYLCHKHPKLLNHKVK